jgi:cytochrome c-type biogenesis protein CcmH
MRKLLLALASLVLLLTGTVANAVNPDEVLADPALEGRARALSAQLRCMVCQNQSIDDSDAELARDLRLLVRERISAGDSDAQVIDFLVARYGEFVLLKPRFSTGNLMLWGAPALLLIVACGAIIALSRRRANADPAVLTDAETKRIEALLERRD